MAADAPWYEAAFVVGVTNAVNVVADSLAAAALKPVDDPDGDATLAALFDDIRAFYARADVPLPFRLVARDPGYARELWGAVRRAFGDNVLSRRLKEALAFAVSLTTHSAWGAEFHVGEMRRLGVGERGVMEVMGVAQMFSSYTKIADTLQLEPDMDRIAPTDPTPAPGGGPAAPS
jgi:AhpD family alkylhydroperoxidase